MWRVVFKISGVTTCTNLDVFVYLFVLQKIVCVVWGNVHLAESGAAGRRWKLVISLGMVCPF